MPGRIAYRDAGVGDGLAIATVWVAAWQAAYAGLMPIEYLDSLDAEVAIPAFQAGLREGMSVMVVEVDGGVAGFTAFGRSRDGDAGDTTGEVIAINLLPSHWRQGLGRELLRHTLDRLRAGGFSRATLWVLHGNDPARRFYEAVGWRADGAEKRDDQLTGFELHEVRYRVDL